MWNPLLDPSIPIGDAVDAIETVIVPAPAIWAGSKCAARFPRRSGRWWGPSSSSTRWARPSS